MPFFRSLRNIHGNLPITSTNETPQIIWINKEKQKFLFFSPWLLNTVVIQSRKGVDGWENLFVPWKGVQTCFKNTVAYQSELSCSRQEINLNLNSSSTDELSARSSHCTVNAYKTVKLSLPTPLRHTGRSGDIAPLILNLRTINNPGTHWTGGWVGPQSRSERYEEENLIFMDPCIVVWFSRNNQQDATL